MAALTSAMQDEYGDNVDYDDDYYDYDDDDDFQYSTPPPMPPARGMYLGSFLESRHHPFHAREESTVVSQSGALCQPQSPHYVTSREWDSVMSSDSLTSTTSGGSSSNNNNNSSSNECINKNVTSKRQHRSRHVRSKFVLDGNFAFASTTKPSFERAATMPLSALEQEQQHQQQQRGSFVGRQVVDPSSYRTNRNFSSSQNRTRAVSTPNFTKF
jgi:hypothetical protein